MIVAALMATSFSISTQNLQAQGLKVPAPSPAQTLKQSFALSDITVEYSRPSAKGRTIYGDLVPFGKMWRTGANGATKITFGENVTVEGMAVPAGTYALYSIPNKDNWEFMLYKDLTLGGNVSEYKATEELIRFKVKPTSITGQSLVAEMPAKGKKKVEAMPLSTYKVETFTINIADVAPNMANIELLWEQTRVAFSVKSDIDTKIMKNIETSLAADTRPYFQAATYYFENGKDIKKASEWVNKAVELNPKAYWIALLKAKIQMKMMDKTGALATAADVVKLATDAKNDDYVKMGEQALADAKKMK